MSKSYYSLGLMSGTSADGVDASIIYTDGKSKYRSILDWYFEYPRNIFNRLTSLKDKIKNSKDSDTKLNRRVFYINKIELIN